MRTRSISASIGIIISLYYLSIGDSVGQSFAKDSAAVDQLYQKSKPFWTSNIDSATMYLRQADERAKKIGYQRGVAYTTYGFGVIEKVLYRKFQYFARSLEIFETLHDKFGVGLNLVRIGVIYSQIGQTEKALEYYQRSLAVKKEINDYGGVALTLINIGQYYQSRADYQKALAYFKESLIYRHKEGTHQGIAYAQTNIAGALLKLNHAEEAAVLADSAIYHFSFTKDPVGHVMSKEVKGEALLKLGKPQEAEQWFSQVAEYQTKNIYVPSYLTALKKLSEILATRGNMAKAFEFQSRYLVAKDSMLNQDYRAETQRLVNEFEFKTSEQNALREKAIQEQQINRRNTMEYLSIVIVVFVLFALVFSGRKKISDRVINALLLVGLMMLFEFLLVLTDNPVEKLTNGEPVLKLLANMVLALLILPGHQFLEKYIHRKLLKPNTAD